MATKRNYPNNYFAWYNDDNRLAVVALDVGGSYCTLSAYNNKSDCESNGGTWVVGGTTTTDKYDTYTGSDVTNGIRMHYHSKYTSVSDIDDNLTTGAGVDSGLHPAIVDYVKSRMLEDMGDLQNSQYFSHFLSCFH